jgi:hypothetical protein
MFSFIKKFFSLFFKKLNSSSVVVPTEKPNDVIVIPVDKPNEPVEKPPVVSPIVEKVPEPVLVNSAAQLILADDAYFDNTALPLILIFEGLYSDRKNDYGGRTMKGITQKEYDSYRMKKGIASQHVKLISDEEVRDIYYRNYWLSSQCNNMSQKVSVCVFDSSVNCGQGRSIKFLQKAVGAKVDGIIGMETLVKLKNFSEDAITKSFLDNKEQYYKNIVSNDSTQQEFLAGWLRRTSMIRDFVDGNKSLDQIKESW